MPVKFPRLVLWLALSVVLSIAALLVQANYPGNVLAVTLYKLHLMSLAGWGGYWLDRALFPYDRPHTYLEEPEPAPNRSRKARSSWGASPSQAMPTATRCFGEPSSSPPP